MAQVSHAGRRPFLDHMAEFYVDQLTKRSSRSISNAASWLICEGYKAAIEKFDYEVRPKAKSVEESDERVTVALYLPKSVADEVRRLASVDKLSLSACASQLLRAGLNQRA